MKRLSRMVGVTLLEIMLVLALASLVLVMSIRYYQSTQNALGIQQMQRAVAAVIAFADSYGLSAGTYAKMTTAGIYASLPKDMQGTSPNIKTQWGDAIFAISDANATSYKGSITLPSTAPSSVCEQVAGFIGNVTREHGGSNAKCDGAAVTWTYTLNPST